MGKVRIQLIWIFGIIEDAVDIRVAVGESRKQKTGNRRLYKPVADAFLDSVCLFVVAKTWFCQPDRADCTEHKIIVIFGGIKLLQIVGSFFGNVICAVYKNNVIVFRINKGLDNFVVKFIEQCVVF